MSNDAVVMVCPALPVEAFPVNVAPGIAIQLHSVAEEPLWTAVQRAAEPHFAIADDLFAKQFGFDPEGVAERCYLAVDENTGDAVGTCAAWYGTDQWDGWGRIHWVAVRPDYQRRGIARAMLAVSMNRLRERGHEKAYLVTSTARLGAIRLYLDFGFHPDWTYHGDSWREVAQSIEHPALRV